MVENGCSLLPLARCSSYTSHAPPQQMPAHGATESASWCFMGHQINWRVEWVIMGSHTKHKATCNGQREWVTCSRWNNETESKATSHHMTPSNVGQGNQKQCQRG